MKWTAREIACSLHRHVFNGRHLVIVPDCLWTGYECDLLVVRRDLRLVDVEIKISRSDLKADAAKDKWFDRPWTWPIGTERPQGVRRTHPPKIWKHYYAFPSSIWKDGIEADIPAASGILFIRDRDTCPLVTVRRQAKPNREAKAVSAEDVCDIARLASERMWRAFDEIDQFWRQRELAQRRDEHPPGHLGDINGPGCDPDTP